LTKTGLLKSDYLAQTFFNFSDPLFYVLWALPFLITYLVIWQFPKWLSVPAFKKEVEYETEKRRIEIIEQRKLEEENIRKLDVVAEKTKKEKKISQIDPKIVWNEEFKQFKNSRIYRKFNLLVDSIYKHSGNVVEKDVYDNVSFEIPKDILVYSHTNDLINLDKIKNKIELTEKGKFFVKLFSLETEKNVTSLAL